MNPIEVKRLGRFFTKKGTIPDFSGVADPRARRGRRWKSQSLLLATLCGMLRGTRCFRGVESFTDGLRGPRRRLGISRRVPDSTLASFFSRLEDESGIREVLVRQVRDAERRKSLEPIDMPINIAAIDGKTIHCGRSAVEDDACQHLPHEHGDFYRLHALHAVLVTAISQPCIDQWLVEGTTNEQGAVCGFIDQLVCTYGRSRRIECISLDAGMGAAATAQHINANALGYIISIKENQPTLRSEARRLCGSGANKQRGFKCEFATPWESYRGGFTRRELFRSTEIAGWPGWESIRQVWRIKQTHRCSKGKTTVTNKYYVTNLPEQKLKPSQIVHAIRLHWGVENGCHWVTDVVLGEDSNPWCTKGKALRMLSWLRLIASNILGFLRRRYLRRNKLIPFRNLLEGLATLFTTPDVWQTPAGKRDLAAPL